jgi:hypothetical protein
MPIGYRAAVTFIAWCTLFAVAPPRPRQSSPSSKSYWFGFLVNELPFVAFYWLLASTLLAFAQGDIRSPGGWVAFGVAVLATVGLVVDARRGLRAGSAVDHALSEGPGAGWRAAIDAGMAARLRRRLPWARILLGPFSSAGAMSSGRQHQLRRRGQTHLDVSRHRSHPSGGPTLIYLHGERSAAAGRTTRRGPSCTASRARVGCASAPTTA